MAEHPRGSLVTGKVQSVDARGAQIDLGDGVEGYLKASEIKKDRVEDATRELEVGQEVEAKFISLDRKGRTLNLSIRAKESEELQEALEEYQQSNASRGTTSLGDLLKEQLDEKS
jgi:small subunit ribosomal protein S1